MMSSPAPARRKMKPTSSQNIKVFLRCRPMNSMERASKSYNIVQVPNSREVVVKERPTDKYAKTFTFDHVFGHDSKQIDVYKAVAKNSVEEVLNGFNCTIFAYGQTGTGKTFTMEGERASTTTSWEEDPLAGIIPRCVNHLFDELRMQKVEFTMRVSFLELYNEELFDLLSAHDDLSKLRLYEDSSKKGSCIIQGLEEVLVRSKSDVYNILEKGSTKRQTAATLMNAHSSRSHTVFTVTLHMKENTVDGDELLKTGKLHLVDLAGSENIGRSGAVEKRAREAGNINMSLLTLGRVITSLVEKAPHIPYRESKLTRLLQDALGGRTKTSVIATISPASVNQEETLSTLDYAHRAKNIQNKPEVNQKLHKKELIGEYSQEIERLRLDLLAMREKSGVYLANENYQEMLATIESQEQEITEKIGHIRTLQAEMEKKIELFSVVSEQLDTTTKQLSSTKEQLQDTRTTLSCTQRLLHTTAQEREEQRYLVEAHCVTEEKLQTEGHTLINVASSTTSDLSRLHDKLDRKRNVETKNNEVIEDFQESYADLQDSLKEKLMSSLTQHTHTLTSATSRHCESVGECRGVVRETGSCVGQLAERQAALTSTALTMVKKMTEVLMGGVQEGWGEVHTASAQQKDMLLVLLDVNKQVLEELASTISAGTSSVAALHSAVLDKLKVMEDVCKDLDQHQASFTSEIQTQVQAQHTALLHHAEEVRSKLNSLGHTQDTHAKDLEADLEALHNLLTTIQSKTNKHTTSHKQHFEQTQHSLTLFTDQVHNTNKITDIATQAQDQAASLLGDIRAHTGETRTRLDDGVDELDRTMQQLGEKRCEMETALEQQVGQVQLSLEASTAAQDRHNKRLKERVAAHVKGVQEEMEAGKESMKQALTSHSHTLLKEADSLAHTQALLQDRVKEVQEGLKEIGLEVDNTYRAQKEMVLGLLTQDIVQDVPTGQTPVRREYPFPNSLPVTSPHDRLLERFRTATGSSAERLKIPSLALGDDLEDDLGETSISSSTSSSTSPSMNEDDLAAGDITTTSRSRSGSVSSLKDQVFAVPRPRMQREDSGIPLSRSSSSSSVTEGKENVRGTKQNSSNKKREIKPPVFRSTSFEKLNTPNTTTTTTTATASEGRTRRILGSQN